MKFDLENKSKFMSHLLLKDSDLATEVATTPFWREDKTLEATLQINGVDVPAEHLESFMKGLWERACSQIKGQYKIDDFEKRVEERANKLLQEHADNALEELHILTEKLQNIGDVLKPHWERETMREK